MRRRQGAFGALALVAAWALVVATAPWSAAAAGGERAAAGGGDLRTRRAALLLEIADLTDRRERTQAAVVGAQLRRARLFEEVSTVRDRVRSRAVRAYIHGTGLGVSDVGAREMAAPAAYLEVTARKERELLERLRTASAEAERQEAAAYRAGEELQDADVSLGRAREELDRLVAEEDARRLAAIQAAEAAELAAAEAAAREEASRAANEARRRATEAAQQHAATEGAAHPQLLVPRHREATRRQAELMATYPFGVLPALPGGALPSSLRATGQHTSGEASWYGGMFNGRPTASGAIYDQELWTAASRTLPLGTMVVVSRNGVRVLLLINDRGPYVDGRVIDLSAIAARALGVGVSVVEIEVVVPA